MSSDIKPQPCPWCGRDAYAYLSGSYCAGWTCFIGCSSEECKARGPSYRSGFKSNNEEKTERMAVKAWDKIAMPK